jgi:hypothetical protein
LIFVHGWQRNSAAERLMETFNYLRIDSKYGINSELADPWLKAGWNVGIFYWTAFADEAEVRARWMLYVACCMFYVAWLLHRPSHSTGSLYVACFTLHGRCRSGH